MHSSKEGEEVKRLVKQLFVEKLKVKALEGQLQQSSDKQALTINQKELVSKLQQELDEKEAMVAKLATQLGKTKPALKQLYDQIQVLKEELEAKQALEPKEEDSFFEELKKAYEISEQALISCKEENRKLKKELEDEREYHQKEAHRFDAERSRLLEKLTESITSHTRQQEIIKQWHEEIHRLKQINSELKHHADRAKSDLESLMNQKIKDNELLNSFLEKEKLWSKQEEVLTSRIAYLEQKVADNRQPELMLSYENKIRQLQEEQDKQLKQATEQYERIVKKNLELEKQKDGLLEHAYKQQKALTELELEKEKQQDELKAALERLTYKSTPSVTDSLPEWVSAKLKS